MRRCAVIFFGLCACSLFKTQYFLYARYFLYVTKKLSAVFFAGFACKKTLGQFFPSFACFAHKKLSAESRPSAWYRRYALHNPANMVELVSVSYPPRCFLVPVYWWVRYRTIVPPNGLGYAPKFTGGERENRLFYGNKIISPAARISSLWHKKTLGTLQHSATLHLEALRSIPHTILFSLPQQQQ